MAWKRSFLGNVLLSLALLCLVTFAIFPFLQILSTSLKYQSDWGNPSLIPTRINLGAYKELLGIGTADTDKLPPAIAKLLSNPALSEAQRKQISSRYVSTADVFPLLLYFRNSFILSASAALASVTLALFGAYALSRMNFVGRSIIQRSILLVYMIGGVLLMVPLYQMAVRSGLAQSPHGAMISVALIYIMQTLPVSLYMLGNYFRSIPFSLEEAAAVDGYTRTESIFRIIVPLSTPMLVTVFVYCFIIAWNEYLFASVFLKQFPEFFTLPIGLQTLFNSKTAIWDRIMAASMLTLVPVVVLFMAATRGLTGGLTEGGVKE